MLFQSSCPTSALVAWCRALKHGLGVGLLPGRVFRQQAKSGPTALRAVAGRIADRVESGDSLTEALRPEVGRFPVLFVESVAVGEQSGRLSDVLGELESHYTLLQSARSRFITSLLWPAFSLGAGILVVTILIAVLGSINPNMDVLGLGLTGTSGAIAFLVIAVLLVGGAIGAAIAIANDESLKSKALGAMIGLPVLGGCVRAFALQRFSLAWRFLAEAGLNADRTVAVALRATANRAYRQHEVTTAKKLRKGREVPEVLAECGTTLFPDEYLEAVRVGEETGQLAEVMGRQAKYYQEESERKLGTITRVANGAIYAFIGLLMIIAIFRIFNSTMNQSNEDLKALEKMAYGWRGNADDSSNVSRAAGVSPPWKWEVVSSFTEG